MLPHLFNLFKTLCKQKKIKKNSIHSDPTNCCIPRTNEFCLLGIHVHALTKTRLPISSQTTGCSSTTARWCTRCHHIHLTQSTSHALHASSLGLFVVSRIRFIFICHLVVDWLPQRKDRESLSSAANIYLFSLRLLQFSRLHNRFHRFKFNKTVPKYIDIVLIANG